MKNVLKELPVFQLLAMVTGTLNIVNSGMQYGWPSPTLPQLLSEDSSIPTTSDEGLWVSVVILFGAVCGAILAGLLLDRIGRKNTILLSSLPFFASWLMIAFAQSVDLLIAARFIAGLSDGLIWCGIPMYLGEIADPKIRGLLGSASSVSWILGMLLINIVGSYLTIKTTALICAVLPVLLLMTFSWLPESPYYLLMKGDVDKARKSLRTFKGSTDVEGEIERISVAIEEQKKSSGNFLDLFKVKSNRKALIIVMGARGAQQFSGTAAIMFYAQIIFEEAGDSISPSTGSIIYFGIQFLLSGFSTALVDKYGRKPLMIVSITGSGLALLVEACYFYMQNMTSIDVSRFSIISIIALVFYVMVFSIGLQTIPIVLLGEIFSTNVKAFAICFADIYLAVIMTTVSKFFQVTKDEFGLHVPFFAFAFFCLLGLIFIIFFIPETKGKTLEEIQVMLEGKNCKARRNVVT